MVLDWVKQAYPGRHDLRILDAGCGTGLMLQQLAELGPADGIERLSYVSMFLLPVIFLGRQWLKVTLRFKSRDTENDLHPQWSNGILRRVFESEIPLLHNGNLPFGASLLCVARKA